MESRDKIIKIEVVMPRRFQAELDLVRFIQHRLESCRNETIAVENRRSILELCLTTRLH